MLLFFAQCERCIEQFARGPARIGKVQTNFFHRHRSSQLLIVRETKSEASCCTKWLAPGIVTSVKSIPIQSQVLFSAPESNAVSPNPWIIKTGIFVFTTGDVSSTYGSRG